METFSPEKTSPAEKKRALVSDMEAPAKVIRERREKHQLSQEDLAAWIGVSQRKFSYFEEARGRLSARQIQTINTNLDVLDRGGSVADIALPLNLLDEDQFLAIQQKRLSEPNRYIKIYLFGVRRLPVLKQQAYQEKWVENLMGLISYQVFLRLDSLADVDIIPELEKAVSKISEGLLGVKQTNRGAITVYGLTSWSKTHPQLKARFAEFQEHLKQFKGISAAEGPYEMVKPWFDGCRELLLYGWLRSVVFYEDSRGAHSFAAVYLNEVSNDPECSDDGEEGWTFLGHGPTLKLGERIRVFDQAIKKIKQRKQRTEHHTST